MNSFHQNIAGHTAYATLTAPALFGAPVARSAAEPAARSDVRLPDVRSAAGPTRLGPRLPDLSSPAVARAAARAGVTKAELRSLRKAQRDGASNACWTVWTPGSPRPRSGGEVGRYSRGARMRSVISCSHSSRCWRM